MPSRSAKRGGEHTDNVIKIFGTLMLAVEHQARGKDIQVLAENFCEMINLFTVSEIGQLQKKDPKFFSFLQIVFHAIKTSNSQDCKEFVRICESKLRASSVLKYSGPPLLMAGGGVQEGGGAAGKLILCALILWMLTCVDLMMNPGDAVTVSLLTSLVVKLSFGRLSFLTDLLRLSPKAIEYPEKYVNPSLGAVTYVSAGEGAFGSAYEKLAERARALAKDREQLELTKVSADHVVEGGLENLVNCAKSGTCADPVDSLVGTTLAPFKAAQDSRPKLSAEEVANSNALTALESELRTQKGMWAWAGLGERNETLIALLEEKVTALRSTIEATRNVSGIVASLPTLKDRSTVGHMLKAASKAIIEQVREGNAQLPTSMRLANNLNSKPYGNQQVAIPQKSYKAGKQLTVAGLEAAGIAAVKIDVQALAESHPGAELDVVAVHAIGQINDVLRRAQQTVGALDTAVDAGKIKQLVEREFKAPAPSAKPQAFFGLVPSFAFNTPAPSKKSSAQDVILSMALSAAAQAADNNARELEMNAARKLGELFDSNTQKILVETLSKLTDQLVSLDYPGGRVVAKLAAQEAMDMSRLFGARPNLDTMEYARTILQCNTGGPCKKDTFENLQDKTELIRAMKSWGLLQRFNHVKYNIMFSLMSMLSLGGVADALLITIIGLAGLPGRWAMWGVEKAQTKQNLEVAAMKLEAGRQKSLQNAVHKKKEELLARALAGDAVARAELENILAIEASLQGAPRGQSPPGSRGRSRRTPSPPRGAAPLALGPPPPRGAAPLALEPPSPRGAAGTGLLLAAPPPAAAPAPRRRSGSRSPDGHRSQSPTRRPRSRSGSRSPGGAAAGAPRRRSGSHSPSRSPRGAAAPAAAAPRGSLVPDPTITESEKRRRRALRFPSSQRAGSRKMKRRGSKNTRRK